MNVAKIAKKIVKQCRIDNPKHFKLDDHDPAERFGLSTDIGDVEAILAQGIARIIDLQQRLYAHGQWAVLLVFQGMDAAGKDGVVKHVMSGINPQGCEVHAFKAPSTEELEHDFLWRTGKDVPARGRIGIFNRSHYEEVLVVRVHPDLLKQQNLPPAATGKDIWQHRFKEIRAFERNLTRNGTLVLKFHLRISKEEQRKRFLARLEEPFKRWKFSMNDLAERERWDDYMARVSGHDPRNFDRLCALVCRAFGPQARRLAGRLRGDHRGARQAQAGISQGHRQGFEGAERVRAHPQGGG